MGRVNTAKFILISLILAGFIAEHVVQLHIPDAYKLLLGCFIGALVGIFMGWLEE